MEYAITAIVAFLLGGTGTFLAFDRWRRRLTDEKHRLVQQEGKLSEATERVGAAQQRLEAEVATMQAEQAAKEQELRKRVAAAKADRAAFDARVVSYEDLQAENVILKRDLANLDIHVRKLQLDGEGQRQHQSLLDQRGRDLAARFLKDNVEWAGSCLTANNFAASKQRLLKVIGWCREIGFNVSADEENGILTALKAEYERVVRAALEREEQARIKAQIREEQRLEKEVDRELKNLERERAVIQAALARALADQQHGEEVERLKARLAEAEERSRRAISQAQMTKSGHVYVISNIGSFGDGVFKVGMTRRLEPIDRVRELGDASVPFPFDIHMMISSNDAPALESILHRALHKLRINRANPRKEFFKVDLDAIRELVTAHHGEIQYFADAAALEYRQSLTMSDEDEEFIEQVYEKLEDDGVAAVDDE